jgi:hypothetical protein
LISEKAAGFAYGEELRGILARSGSGSQRDSFPIQISPGEIVLDCAGRSLPCELPTDTTGRHRLSTSIQSWSDGFPPSVVVGHRRSFCPLRGCTDPLNASVSHLWFACPGLQPGIGCWPTVLPLAGSFRHSSVLTVPPPSNRPKGWRRTSGLTQSRINSGRSDCRRVLFSPLAKIGIMSADQSANRRLSAVVDATRALLPCRRSAKHSPTVCSPSSSASTPSLVRMTVPPDRRRCCDSGTGAVTITGRWRREVVHDQPLVIRLPNVDSRTPTSPLLSRRVQGADRHGVSP